MADFSDALLSIAREELIAARGDPDRQATAIERIAHVLGIAVAEAAQGNPKGIDTLMAGAESYAHGSAVQVAPLVAMMVQVKSAHRQSGRRRR